MAITSFNARNGLSVGTGSIGVIDLDGNATFASAMTTGSLGVGTPSVSTTRLFVSGSTAASDVTAIFKAGTSSPTGPVFESQSNTGASLLVVSGSGFVGVGNSNPTATLHVGNNDSATLLINGGSKLLIRDSGTYIQEISGLQIESGTGRALHLRTAGSQRLTIDTAGLVGIGTTGPTSALSVWYSDSTAYTPTAQAAPIVSVRNSYGSAANTQAVLGYSTANYSSFWATGLVETGASYSGAYIWQNRTGVSTFVERMRIDSAGNVGIGTTSWSTSRLFISGSAITTDANLIVRAGTPTQSGLVLDAQNSAGSSRFSVDASGNVVVAGNLTVAGTQTVVNSTTVNISDNIILLNSVASPSRYGGIYVADQTANTTGSFIWDSNNDRWYAGLAGSEVAVPTGTGTTNYLARWTDANTLAAAVVQDNGTNVAVGGSPTGDKLSVNGTLSVTGSLQPGTDLTYDLGAAAKRWKTLYAANISGSLTGSNVSAGQVVVAGTGGVLSGSNNFWWDNSTASVGIGTNAPGYKLDVHGDVRFARSGAATQHILFQSNAGANYIRGISAGLGGNSKPLYIGSDSNSSGITLQTEGSGTPLQIIPGNVTTVRFYQTLTEISSSVEPGSDILYDIGSSTKKWRNIYAANISGSLTGSNVTAGQVVVAGTGGVLSGSNNLFWDNSNVRLGVGTGAPTQALHVRGSTGGDVIALVKNDGAGRAVLNLDSGGTSDSVVRFSSQATLKWGILNTPNDLGFYSYATSTYPMFIVGSTGNIGINTTTSSAKLTVSGSSTSSTPTMVVREGIAAPTGGAGTFDVQNSAGTSLLFVSGSGNVGVGTNSPSYKLDVAGDVRVTGNFYRPDGAGIALSIGNGTETHNQDTVIFNSAIGSTTFARLNSTGLGVGATPSSRLYVSGSSTASTPTAIIREGVPSPTGGAAALDVQNSAGTSLLFVSGSGNVGIGTTVSAVPSHRLHVAGKIGGGLFVDSSLEFLASGNTELKANTDLKLGYALSTVIRSTGNVGVGTITPTARLHVSGSTTTSTPTMIVQEGVPSPTGGAGVFDVQNSAGTSILFVSGSNFVGVGTTSNTATAYTFGVRSGTNSQIGVRTLSGIGAAGTGAALDSLTDAGSVQNFGVRAASHQFLVSPTQLALYIVAGGNVGIGSTTTVSARLQVSGSSTTSTPTMVVQEGVASPTGGAGILDVQRSSGTSVLFVSGSGRVGIGTNTPLDALEVNGQIRINDGSVNALNYGTGASSQYLSFSGGTIYHGNTNTGFLFRTSGNTSAVTIDNSGNVGINTSGTGDRFAVNGSASITGSLLPGTDNLYSLGSATKRWNTIFSANVSGSLTGSGLLAGQVVVAGTGGVLSGTNNFVWDNTNTRVGIGSATPGYTLDVAGTLNSQNTIYVQNGSQGFITWNGGVTNTFNVLAASGKSFSIGSNGVYDRLFMDTSGNIGVGTTSYTARLFVSGSSTASTPTMIVREGVASPTGGAGVLNVQNSAGTSLLIVSGSGNVGIGITNPTTYKLDVVGQIKSRNLASGDTTGITLGNNGSEKARIQFTASDDSARFKMEVGGVNGTAERLSVYAGPLNGVATNEVFVIGGNGNVGIGSGAQVTSRLLVTGSGATSSTSTMHLVNSSGASLLYVNDGINVGMGTSSPDTSALLTVDTTANTHIVLRSSGNTQRQAIIASNSGVSSNYNGLAFYSNTNASFSQANTSLSSWRTILGNFDITADRFAVSRMAAGGGSFTEFLTINSSGNVGIGTTLIDSKLAVNGNSVFSGSVNPDADITRDLGSSAKRWNNIYAANISGSLTGSNVFANQVVVAGSGGVLSGSYNLFWDNANQKLGIGTSSVQGSAILQVNRQTGTLPQIALTNSGLPSSVHWIGTGWLSDGLGTTDTLNIGNNLQKSVSIVSSNAAVLTVVDNGTKKLVVLPQANSYVGVGTTNPSSILHVVGHSVAGTPTALIKEGLAAQSSGIAVLDVQNSAGTSLLFVSGSGNVGIGTSAMADKLAVNGTMSVTGSLLPGTDNTYDLGSTTKRWSNVYATNVVSSGSLAPSYTAYTVSGDTALFDTISVTTSGAVYELMIIGNPNSNGDANYRDIVYGKIIIGTGYSGSAVRNYIQFVCESPAPRALYGSGGGPLTADVVYLQTGNEYTDITQGGSATIRVKVSGYNSGSGGIYVGNNTTVRLKQLA